MPQTAILERPLWEGNRRVFVDDAKVRQMAVFVFLYLVAYAFGVMILCACGYSLSDSLFEFASAIGTVGLSVGVTSAQMPDAALWAETIAMFLGRSGVYRDDRQSAQARQGRSIDIGAVAVVKRNQYNGRENEHQ